MTRRKILLIDNDPCLLKLLALELELTGYRVQSYPSAEDALEAMSESPDLAILDYRLPGMDGLTLLQRLRQCYPRLPALIISSDCMLESIPSDPGIPPTHLLRKPFLYATFMEGVKTLLRERSAV